MAFPYSATATRPVLRTFLRSGQARQAFRPRASGQRFQTTSAGPEAAESFASKMWNGPVGVKTVHFWAPVMKWALVITGISDFYRPPEKLSLTQNIALTGTGIIWTRWCLIIKPKNYLLAAVNFFLGCVGLVQVGRIVSWQRSVEASGIGAEAEDAKDKVVGGAKEALAKVKDVAGK